MPFSGRSLREYPGRVVEKMKIDSRPVDFALGGEGDLDGVIEVRKLSRGSREDLVDVERRARYIDSEPRYQGDVAIPIQYSMSSGELDLNRLKVGNAWH